MLNVNWKYLNSYVTQMGRWSVTWLLTQPAFSYSKVTIETQEQDVKYVQS